MKLSFLPNLLSLFLLEISSAYTPPSLSNLVTSVNYFISRDCNYSCKFCFHTASNNDKLGLGRAQLGLMMLQQAGTKKINFAGGEPFLHPELLGSLCQFAVEECHMAVSIISNGSLIRPQWMERFGRYVDILGVSIDSFDPATNAAIGRGDGRESKNQHIERALNVRDLCARHDILFKMNTVVCSLNHREDMNEYVTSLDPYRWKAFQILVLEGENAGGVGDLRDARPLQVSREKFDAFCDRHERQSALIPEPNDVMQNSYLLLDEQLRFLDCSANGKVPSESILEVGVEKALGQAGFDFDMFEVGWVFCLFLFTLVFESKAQSK
jgi:radical S-adenosyl methionine domain-containing protein 2